MSTVERRPAPLVYASKSAVVAAKRILGDNVVVETLIADAISEGRVAYGRDPRVFDDDGRWVAHVRRCPGRLRPRPRAWLITAIKPTKEEPCP